MIRVELRINNLLWYCRKYYSADNLYTYSINENACTVYINNALCGVPKAYYDQSFWSLSILHILMCGYIRSGFLQETAFIVSSYTLHTSLDICLKFDDCNSLLLRITTACQARLQEGYRTAEKRATNFRVADSKMSSFEIKRKIQLFIYSHDSTTLQSSLLLHLLNHHN